MLLPRETLVRRQHSEPLRGLEMERRPVLPRYASLPASTPSHTAGTKHAASKTNITLGTGASLPWPGPDFRLNQILRGSVYLWACGERGEGDGESKVSRSECCAGWVVLIVSAEFLEPVTRWSVLYR